MEINRSKSNKTSGVKGNMKIVNKKVSQTSEDRFVSSCSSPLWTGYKPSCTSCGGYTSCGGHHNYSSC